MNRDSPDIFLSQLNPKEIHYDIVFLFLSPICFHFISFRDNITIEGDSENAQKLMTNAALSHWLYVVDFV